MNKLALLSVVVTLLVVAGTAPTFAASGGCACSCSCCVTCHGATTPDAAAKCCASVAVTAGYCCGADCACGCTYCGTGATCQRGTTADCGGCGSDAGCQHAATPGETTKCCGQAAAK